MEDPYVEFGGISPACRNEELVSWLSSTAAARPVSSMYSTGLEGRGAVRGTCRTPPACSSSTTRDALGRDDVSVPSGSRSTLDVAPPFKPGL